MGLYTFKSEFVSVTPKKKKKKKKGGHQRYVLPKKQIVLMLRYLVDFEHKCLSQLQMTQVDPEASIS
jgi:hypothetical protein